MTENNNEIQEIESVEEIEVQPVQPVQPTQPPVPNESQTQTQDESKSKELQLKAEPKQKKQFSYSTTVPMVPVKIVLPEILEDFEPFEFNFRLALSNEMNEKRQEYLSLSAFEQTKQEKKETLNEVCDLLIELPKGFSDLSQVAGLSAGDSFRLYVQNAPDSQRPIIEQILAGAIGRYWSMIAPRVFRP